MHNEAILEIESVEKIDGLVQRILEGEVVVLRGGLQRLGLYETLVNASLAGIRKVVGEDVAKKVEAAGFERIHEWVRPEDIPAITDAAYREITAIAHLVLGRLIPDLFPDGGAYYFERSPNVRFHIPFDLAARQRREFDKFARKMGDGKITAHGPHRDPWVDCPANAINVWIAVGPVQRGNGLTIFKDDYRAKFEFKDGYVADGTPLHRPLNFDLQPGDAVLFHSNHLHGSELNRTNRTRYVVSYRITFGKPYYPHGHYHHYLHGGLAAGPLRWLAAIPQNLQWSFFAYQIDRLRYKITGRGKMSGRDASAAPTSSVPAPSFDKASIAIADLPIGSIRAVSKSVCVARLGNDHFAAVGRRCPHMGGDLTGGWIDDGKLVCPLHSLPFDPHTGASPCSSLSALRCYAHSIRDGRIHVDLDRDGRAEHKEAVVREQ